jgi:hypothetical protein
MPREEEEDPYPALAKMTMGFSIDELLRLQALVVAAEEIPLDHEPAAGASAPMEEAAQEGGGTYVDADAVDFVVEVVPGVAAGGRPPERIPPRAPDAPRRGGRERAPCRR